MSGFCLILGVPADEARNGPKGKKPGKNGAFWRKVSKPYPIYAYLKQAC